MLEATVTSSVLILVIIAIRFLLRGKISLRLEYALWLLVAVRLFMPFSLFQSPVSVMNMTHPINTRLEAKLEAPVSPQQASPALSTTGQSAAAVAGEPSDLVGSASAADLAEKISIRSILTITWQLGAAAIALWLILQNLFFYRRLRKTRTPVAVPGCKLRVYVAVILPSPCLFGIFRPAIYLTPDRFTSEEKLRHIIAHEMTHYRHGDHLWAFVRGAAISLHWLNPLVWIAAALSRRDCELSCDEGTVLRIGEENRLSYGETLIKMVSARSTPTDLLCGATTMTSGKRGIKERIFMIAKKPKMLKVTLAAVLLISLVAAGCTFTGAQESVTDTGQHYENLGITLDISAAYADTVTLESPENLSDYEFMRAYQTASYITEWGGWMFNIVRHTPGEFEDYWVTSDASGGVRHFAKDDNYIYSIEFPTDVNSSTEQYEAYSALQSEFSDYVMSQMLAQNGLTAYDDSAFQSAYTYTGEHVAVTYWPYLAYGGSKDVSWTLIMSRPVKQGDNGIWCVDRWLDANGLVYYALPKTDKTALEYYTEIQDTCDAGSGAEWLDPVQVALKFVTDVFENYATADSFYAGDIYTGESGYPDATTSTDVGIRLYAPTGLSENTNTGVGVFLDYADDDIVVFHGYFGLFIYDLNKQQITWSADLNRSLGTTNIQGSSGAAVQVSADGETVLLYRYDENGTPEKAFYIDTNTPMQFLYTGYSPLDNAFDNFADLNEAGADPNTFSDRAIKFDDGYGYINCGNTLGGLTYVRGDTEYKVFDGWF
ncbi:MAG: M56 family metallopeptidase [Oscillospiraceae bacterium]